MCQLIAELNSLKAFKNHNASFTCVCVVNSGSTNLNTWHMLLSLTKG